MYDLKKNIFAPNMRFNGSKNSNFFFFLPKYHFVFPVLICAFCVERKLAKFEGERRYWDDLKKNHQTLTQTDIYSNLKPTTTI